MQVKVSAGETYSKLPHDETVWKPRYRLTCKGRRTTGLADIQCSALTHCQLLTLATAATAAAAGWCCMLEVELLNWRDSCRS
jgi:hypothetical protein